MVRRREGMKREKRRRVWRTEEKEAKSTRRERRREIWRV